MSERELHKRLVKLLQFHQKTHDFIFFHIKNEMGKNRYDPESLGILPGVSDFCILTPEKAMFLEIKTDKGRLSNEQRKFLVKVNRLGHRGFVAHGWDDIIDKISVMLESNSEKRIDKAENYQWKPGKVVWLNKAGKPYKQRGPGKVSVFLY